MIRKKNLQGPPFLIVEILSPSTSALDRVTKLNNYASNGVPHYWLLDPDGTLMLLRLDGDTYRVATTLGPGDRHEPPDFPGLVLEMDELFKDMPED